MRGLFLALALLVFSSASAAEADLAKLIGQHKIYSASFTQKKKLPFLKKPFVSKGRVFFHQDQGVFWRTTSPIKQGLLITPTGMFEVQGAQVKPAPGGNAAGQIAGNFAQFFGGDLSKLSESFALQVQKGETGHILLLTPKAKSINAFVSAVELRVGFDGRLQGITITEANQGVSHIEFTGHRLLTRWGEAEQAIYEQSRR